MADFAPRPEVSGEPKSKGKRYAKWIVLLALLIIATVLILTYCYMPSPITPVVNNESPSQVVYTQEQIELIANNSYPAMRYKLVSKDDILASCVATTTENSSICLQLESDIKDCLQDYNLYFSFKGECEKLVTIQEPPINFEMFCNSLKLRSCEGLEERTRIICEAILNNDLIRCIEFTGISRDECVILLSDFRALKENNAVYCNEISRNYAKERCKAFVLGSCEQTIEDITISWIKFELSRQLNSLSICNYITKTYIKGLCQNESMTYNQALNIIK